jgi:hypothetical protein
MYAFMMLTWCYVSGLSHHHAASGRAGTRDIRLGGHNWRVFFALNLLHYAQPIIRDFGSLSEAKWVGDLILPILRILVLLFHAAYKEFRDFMDARKRAK